MLSAVCPLLHVPAGTSRNLTCTMRGFAWRLAHLDTWELGCRCLGAYWGIRLYGLYGSDRFYGPYGCHGAHRGAGDGRYGVCRGHGSHGLYGRLWIYGRHRPIRGLRPYGPQWRHGIHGRHRQHRHTPAAFFMQKTTSVHSLLFCYG